MLQMTMTVAGVTALADAAATGSMLPIVGAVFTDAAQTGELSSKEFVYDLEGAHVFDGACSGKTIGDGRAQVQVIDNSENAYEARTIALYFGNPNAGYRLFAIGTQDDAIVVKTSKAALSIVAAIAVKSGLAGSITFENLNVECPIATEFENGIVTLSRDYYHVFNRPEDDILHPVVPTVQTVHDALAKSFGESFGDGKDEIAQTLNVGTGANAVNQVDIGTWRFSSGDAPEGYKDVMISDIFSGDVHTIVGWLFGSQIGDVAYSSLIVEYEYVSLLMDGSQVGIIMKDRYGTWFMRIMDSYEPYGTTFLYLNMQSQGSVLDAQNIKTRAIKTNTLSTRMATIGGAKKIAFTAADFFIPEAGTYRYRLPVYPKLIRGFEHTPAYLTIGGEIITGEWDSVNLARTWTVNGITYKLSYVHSSFTCTPYAPESGELTFIEDGSVRAGADVKAYDSFSLAQGCNLGFVKILLTYYDGAYSCTIDDKSDSVSCTTSGNSISVTYSGPKLYKNNIWLEVKTNRMVAIGVSSDTGTIIAGTGNTASFDMNIYENVENMPVFVRVV